MNTQIGQGVDAVQVAMIQRRMVLESRVRNGIGWFYWIAGLSLVNTGAHLLGTTWTFVIGLGITQMIDAVMSLLAKDLGEGWGILRVVGAGIDLLIAAAFVLIGYFGRKGIRWPIIAGMALYALDTVVLLLFRDLFAVAFHAWALVGIWNGMKAMQELGRTANLEVGNVRGTGSGIPNRAAGIGQEQADAPMTRQTTSREDGLAQLERAYDGFVQAVSSLSPEAFLRSLNGWSPRDVVAHLIGWNRYILTGCEQLRSGVAPFYHKDGANDYRQINAVSVAKYSATHRQALLDELRTSKDELAAYVKGLNEKEWEKDWGARHYRGGPATVGRSIESLMKDYDNHAREIARMLPGS